MTPELLHHLRARSPAIHVRWETLLRIEPVNGPLANPDALVRLIPETLARILSDLGKPSTPVSLKTARGAELHGCDCGHNPYLAFFVAAEQALVETVVLLQSELPHTQKAETDVAEVIHLARTIARDEIDTFCGICTYRGSDAKCRHVVV